MKTRINKIPLDSGIRKDTGGHVLWPGKIQGFFYLRRFIMSKETYEFASDLQPELLQIQNKVAAISIGLHGVADSLLTIQDDELYGFSNILSECSGDLAKILGSIKGPAEDEPDAPGAQS